MDQRPIRYLQPDDLSAYDAADPNSVDWLTKALRDEVAKCFPEEGDIIDVVTGEADCDKLAAAACKLFENRKHFCNFYQLKQYTQLFANEWGFIVSTKNSWDLECAYGSRISFYKSTVPPEKKRAKSSIKSGCTFLIRSSRQIRDLKGLPKNRNPVKVSMPRPVTNKNGSEANVSTRVHTCFQHTCVTGKRAMLRAIKAGGRQKLGTIKTPEVEPEPPKRWIPPPPAAARAAADDSSDVGMGGQEEDDEAEMHAPSGSQQQAHPSRSELIEMWTDVIDRSIGHADRVELLLAFHKFLMGGQEQESSSGRGLFDITAAIASGRSR